MIQRIEFVIPGPIASDHRRIESWFDRNKKRRAKPMVFRPQSYNQFRERARRAAEKAKQEQGWIVPAKTVAVKMYVEFHLATQKMTKPHQLVDKRGRKLSAHLVPRTRPDHDNCEKCVKDALQRDRAKHGRIVDQRCLYIDDKLVDCYPFPGKEWFVTEPGTEEWIVVALEIVGEFQPHVEQSELFNAPRTARQVGKEPSRAGDQKPHLVPVRPIIEEEF